MSHKLLLLFLIICLNGLPVTGQIVVLNGSPRDTSYTLYSSFIKVKKNYPFVRQVDSKLPADILVKENIIYKILPESSFGNRELKLSVFRPKKGTSYPVVLMIHGGGWNSGSPEMQRTLAQDLSKKGFATVTVEYRLSPEALYPAAVEDLNDAISWIYNHSAEYGFDRDKIAVEGCSAGGQLASLIGSINKDKLIKAIVNVDGISSFVDQATIDRAEQYRQKGGKIPADLQWLGETYAEKPQTWKDASAVYWVNESSAPVCFINSSVPRFHNGRNEHRRLLKSYGIYSEIYSFENTPHTFWLFYPWHSLTVDYTARFLQRIFDTKKENLSEPDRL